jgi:hypothetical protein
MIRQPEQYYTPRAIVDSNQSYPTKNQTWEDVARLTSKGSKQALLPKAGTLECRSAIFLSMDNHSDVPLQRCLTLSELSKFVLDA